MLHGCSGASPSSLVGPLTSYDDEGASSGRSSAGASSHLVDRPGQRLGQHGRRKRGGLGASRGRVNDAPPWLDACRVRWLGRFAEARHHDSRASSWSQLEQDLRGLVPCVRRETESAPVHGQEGTAAEERERLERVFRSEVHVAPGGMERAYFQHHQVKRPEPIANDLIFSREPGIAAEEHGVPRRSYDKRGPQGCIAALEGAAGKVLRGRGGYYQVAVWQGMRLPPVQFDDTFGLHAPGFEVRAHSERRYEWHVAFCEFADGRVIEVVEMIVRHDDEIYGWHCPQGNGHRLEALGPRKPRRRCARSPDRIGEHAQAVDLDQHGGMTEPRGA